jgi:hypothetical protein
MRLVCTVALVTLLVLTVATLALGADPSAIPADLVETGDLRSEGEGPGLVGSPLLILAGVVGLGLVTAAVTVVGVRLIRRD